MTDLRCPHCGGKLWIRCEYDGSAYLSENTPELIECDGECEATWETDGTARDEPKWVRYPDLYPPPCGAYSNGTDGWACAATGPHDEHRNAAGDVRWGDA